MGHLSLKGSARALLTVTDLLSIDVYENGWPLVCLQELLPHIRAQYKKPDMLPYTGENILVREELLPLLRTAYKKLQEVKTGYNFWICYGYRHPEIQQRYYEARYAVHKKEWPNLSESELVELTHTQVAFPEVAGHPTGGAIDITLVDEKGRELDMGTGIAEYSEPEKCFTFSKSITRVQAKNRQLLRKILMSVGFAPFNGEWWHFSYGDREWAYFYGKECSLFNQVEI